MAFSAEGVGDAAGNAVLRDGVAVEADAVSVAVAFPVVSPNENPTVAALDDAVGAAVSVVPVAVAVAAAEDEGMVVVAAELDEAVALDEAVGSKVDEGMGRAADAVGCDTAGVNPENSDGAVDVEAGTVVVEVGTAAEAAGCCAGGEEKLNVVLSEGWDEATAGVEVAGAAVPVWAALEEAKENSRVSVVAGELKENPVAGAAEDWAVAAGVDENENPWVVVVGADATCWGAAAAATG